jgi:hypothetical protein
MPKAFAQDLGRDPALTLCVPQDDGYRYLYFGLILSIILAIPVLSLAAAWTSPEGETNIFNSFTYYETAHFLDQDGKSIPQAKFLQYTYNPYIEYGLENDLTLGASPLFEYQTEKGDQSSAFYGSDIFFRKKLYEDGAQVFSLQPQITIPGLYNGSALPQIGAKVFANELRLLHGYGFAALDQNHFTDLEIAYNKRYGANDQVEFDATLGLRFTEDLLLLNQIFSTFSTQAVKTNRIAITGSNDYNLVKMQFSLVKEIFPDVSVQAGLSRNIWGENTGGGGSMIFSLWYKF